MLTNNLRKIIMSMSNIGDVSKKIIKHGMQLSCGLIAIAIVMYVASVLVFGYDYARYYFIFEAASTALSLFAEAIIGAIIIDYVASLKQ